VVVVFVVVAIAGGGKGESFAIFMQKDRKQRRYERDEDISKQQGECIYV
jgi:hypothetical protein|tara:strand:- start:86 stop:232 length:147 start_codon:yes stop_codon:yes gene_type:complete